MRRCVSLEEVLSYSLVHYAGDCFFTAVSGREWMFVKGLLANTPQSFLNPFFKSKVDHCGCYLIRHLDTGEVYVGSSESIYKRVLRHKQFIYAKSHDNSNFQELLQKTTIKDYELILFFTDTREEAFELEQFFVDRYKASGKLINIAYDVRYAMLGAVLSDEHKQKISVANTGRLMSEDSKRKLSEARQVSVRAQAQISRVNAHKRRSILFDGIQYESITAAANTLGRSESWIRKALARNKSGSAYLSEATSSLAGKPLTVEQRNKLSLARKANPKAQSQFEAASMKVRRPIILNGVLYNSVQEAVRYTGISEPTIHRKLRLTGGKTTEGPYVLNYVRASP